MAIVALATCQDTSSPPKKFNTGHYVAVGPFHPMDSIRHLHEPAIRGVNKRYFWRSLEPERGQYDFSEIRADLELLAKQDKQLVVFIIDRSWSRVGPLPEYLKAYEHAGEYGGFLCERWAPEVVNRMVALGEALGQAFDDHPNFEGVAVQETSLDFSDQAYERLGYTPDKYRDALITMLHGLQGAFATSRVFWYQNFMHQNKGRLAQIADTLVGTGVVMGGPDVLPHRVGIRRSYKIYDQFQGRLPLFCSMQDDSFHHHKNDVNVAVQEPMHEEGLIPLQTLYAFARDELHVQYLFWNHYYEGKDRGEFSFDDAIPVIKANPVFNEEMTESEK